MSYSKFYLNNFIWIVKNPLFKIFSLEILPSSGYINDFLQPNGTLIIVG